MGNHCGYYAMHLSTFGEDSFILEVVLSRIVTTDDIQRIIYQKLLPPSPRGGCQAPLWRQRQGHRCVLPFA